MAEADSSLSSHLAKRVGALTSAQKAELRRRLNERAQPPSLLHELFVQQTLATPSAPALVLGESSLAFDEVNKAANRLARRLQELGVGPGIPVALCLERSFELVIAQLAVLKAGGAYLPIDLGYPQARIEFMLTDSGSPVVLTGSSQLDTCSTAKAEVLCLDREQGLLYTGEAPEPPCQAGAEDPAYIIYTSGSTGQPKGALIPHRAIVNYMVWMLSRFSLTPSDAVLQKTPVSADASVWEFYLPLMTGARLVLAEPGSHLDPGLLARQIIKESVTTVQFVPSMLDLFMEHPRSGECLSLKRIYSIGEPLTPSLARRVRDRLPVELVNLYGPTETTVASSYFVCDGRDYGPRVPIGKPVSNTRFYVLNEHLKPVPTGEQGELYIGGKGVGLGYLNRPELTSSRFLPDPYSNNSADRLYRTGDRCLELPDGNFDFLGRTDHQVKIRGFRIEPGEVEAVLMGIPGLQSALVTVFSEESSEDRLIAYIRPDQSGVIPSTEAMRQALALNLPSHMIPTEFVPIENWPLMPNGKVDRRALPIPSRSAVLIAHSPDGPPTEERMCQLWAGLLGLPAVEKDDNFFEIGGHSLLGVRLLGIINREWGREVPLKVLFSTPTVSGLIQFLQQEVLDESVPLPEALDQARPASSSVGQEASNPISGTRPITAPRSPMEERLAAQWAELLGLDAVGIHENFFELGGHSLMAARLFAWIYKELELDVPLRSIFEHPTVAGLAECIESARNQADSSRSRDGRDSLATASKVQPLSFSQQRFWFIHQLDPHSSQFNMSQAVILRGRLNTEALVSALNAVIARHENLRTRFVHKYGEPFRVVQAEFLLPLTVEDHGEISPEEQKLRLEEILKEEMRAPFRLQEAPPLRARLVRLSEDTHGFLFICHHIISDGTSAILFNRELAAYYREFSGGVQASLPPLEITFSAYVHQQRLRLEGDQGRKEMAYWERKLAKAPPFLKLPVDGSTSGPLARQAGSVVRMLPAELTRDWESFCQRRRVTLFMGSLAVFKFLLGRLAGQEDVVIGIPIAGRNDLGVDRLIGLFIGTLALRTDLSGNPSFLDLLDRVRTTVIEGFDHQLVPFEKIVEKSQPVREIDSTPLFQVLFNMVPAEDKDRLELPSLDAEEIKTEAAEAKYALTLYLRKESGGLEFRAVYKKGLFRARTVEIILDQYLHLLKEVLANPEQPVLGYSLITARTRALLPDPTLPLPERRLPTVSEQFVKQALDQPSLTAVAQGRDCWTYGHLEMVSRAVANRLEGMGMHWGEVVLITGGRSFGLFAALMGVMRTRAVLYLMDPDLPAGRREVLLRESGARYMIAVGEPVEGESRWGEDFQSLPLLEMSPEGEFIKGSPFSDDEPVSFELPAPSDPAYIFFTSGTTGIPKAILGNHKGLSHFINWEGMLLGVRPDDRVAQLTGLSFDVILRDIFLPLCHGGTLCLPESMVRIEGPSAFPWLEEEKITILHTVPSLASSWMAGMPETLDLALRAVLFAGEPLSSSFIHKWRSRAGASPTLYNLYGATETTLAKSYYVIPDDPLDGIQPIGRPMPDTQFWVLNSAGTPCGIREPGEIVIRTPFRSNGYLHNQEDQATRFRANPFVSDPDDVVYYTGDRGAFSAEGEVLIFGRLDDQVKIRGIRIEPAEVGSVLSRHPAVRQCVVTAMDGGEGGKHLAAYCVEEPSQAEATVPALKEFLRKTLPEYMIPTTFTFMERLPLSPNGKVDRHALPAPEISNEPHESRLAPPRTRIEEDLVNIWEELLGCKGVGIQDNFFDLGGHSLLATRMLAIVLQQTGLELPLRSLFENPTIEGLLRSLKDSPGPERHALAPLREVPPVQRIPLSLSQERLWFLDRLGSGSPEYNMAAAVRLQGEVQTGLLERALGLVVERHESLRTTFTEIAGEPIQVIHRVSRVPLEHIGVSGQETDSREDLLEKSLRRFLDHVFDLSEGPLMRAALIRLDSSEYVFAWMCHHIISDGWSVGVFNRDLGQAYSALSKGKQPDWKPLSSQYTDFTRWQREHLSGDRLRKQRAFWVSRLQDAPLLELPVDRPRPPRIDHSGGRYPFHLPDSLGRRLATFNRENGLTPYMTFMAAFQVLLSRYTGQEEILVGTPIANRQRVEFEPLIGFFVNTLVQRTDLSGRPSFREVLTRVKEGALSAFEHQDLPFNKVIEAVNPPRDLARHPVFQVSMALQNIPRASPEFEGLTVSGVGLPLKSTHFELGLSFWLEGELWKGSLSYMTRIFDSTTIARIVDHFQRLLSSLLDHPNCPVDEVPLLAEEERHRIIFDWNDTATSYPRDQSVHDLFREQVGNNPQAVALEEGSRRLTYQELDRASEVLSRRLLGCGVERGQFVGVFLDRSVELVVAFLGILKAGAAYVPLARDYPSSRIRYIITDAGLKVILTTEDHLEGAGEDVRLLDPLCSETNDGVDESGEGGLVVSPEDPAYVIYTSGSTGEPKGVVVSHRAILRLVRGQSYADFGPGERYLLLASPAFDASTYEIWGSLLNGGTLAVFPSRYPDLSVLRATLQKHQTTCLWLTTGLFNLIVDTDPALLESVGHILTGGETLSPGHVRKAIVALPGVRLTNCYGPTECTTFACTYKIPINHPGDQPVPLGRPIGNTRAYILDPLRQPVPVGVAGELYLGGDGLALGYLNQPKLTAETFLPDPFAADPDARMYRTGDQCRYLEDGRIEFLGRLDQQIKIRGYRLELGEVEAALVSHPDIRQAVVTAGKGSDGTTRLAAFYVPTRMESPLDEKECKAFLGQRLPDYAIPAFLIAIKAVPLTPNGKVDLKALPPVDSFRGMKQPAKEARSRLEQQIADIWKKLFNREAIDRDDNFFSLGGHSLLAARMLAEVERITGQRLPISSIFESPTVEALAARLESPGPAEVKGSLVALQEEGTRVPLFCLHGWGGDVYGFLDLARVLAPEQPVYGLQAIGLKDGTPRHTTVDQMTDHYVQEIQAFRPEGPYLLLGYSAGGWIAYAVAQRLSNAGKEVRLFMLDTSASCKIPYVFHAFNKTMRLLVRLPFHIRRFQESSEGNRWAYLRDRLGWLMVNIRRTGAPPASRQEAKENPSPLNDSAEAYPVPRGTDYFALVASKYRPKPYRGDLVLFACRGSPAYGRLFWKYLIRGRIRVHFVDGGHLGVINRENVGNFAEVFKSVLYEQSGQKRAKNLSRSKTELKSRT